MLRSSFVCELQQESIFYNHLHAVCAVEIKLAKFIGEKKKKKVTDVSNYHIWFEDLPL